MSTGSARVWLDGGRDKTRALGKPVVDHPFLDSYAVAVDGKAEAYESLLRSLPPGLSVGGPPRAGHRRVAGDEPAGWQTRHSDHAFLTSDRAREILDDEGIHVID